MRVRSAPPDAEPPPMAHCQRGVHICKPDRARGANSRCVAPRRSVANEQQRPCGRPHGRAVASDAWRNRVGQRRAASVSGRRIGDRDAERRVVCRASRRRDPGGARRDRPLRGPDRGRQRRRDPAPGRDPGPHRPQRRGQDHPGQRDDRLSGSRRRRGSCSAAR